MLIQEIKNQSYNKKYYLDLRAIQNYYPEVILEENFLIFGNENSKFSLLITKEDLKKKEFWDFINLFYKINIIKLAKWWDLFFKEIEPTGLFVSKNWSDNYKTRNDWEEWKTFRRESEILYEIYEFPIQIIRLWDRLNEEIQNFWLKILEIFPIKKNLMKEILMDLYDLPLETQLEISKTCYAYIQEQIQGKALTIEIQETIRDQIKKLRYPLYYERKKESYHLKKKLESLIKLKNLEISIPEDLESKPIEVKFFIYKEKDLNNLLEKFSEVQIKENFKELIAKVFEL